MKGICIYEICTGLYSVMFEKRKALSNNYKRYLNMSEPTLPTRSFTPKLQKILSVISQGSHFAWSPSTVFP